MNALRNGIRTAGLGLTLALATFCAPDELAAQSKTGTAFGSFLQIEPSARVAGMGNAGVSIDGGLETAYYNPAAVGRLDRWTFTFNHAAWFADITYDYAALGAPMGKWGNAFLTLTMLGSGQMDVRTVQSPLGTGETFTVSDAALGLGYALEVTDRFSAGGQISWVQERIWHSTAGTVTFNLGTLYRTSVNGLRIGASLANFGTQSRFDGRDLRILFDQDPSIHGDNGTLPGSMFTDAFSVPVMFRAGIGQAFQVANDARLDVVLDAFHPGDNTESISAGTELELRKTLALRAGYQNLFLQDSELGPTLGAGILGERPSFHYRVDYAWADQGRLGSSHRFSLGLRF